MIPGIWKLFLALIHVLPATLAFTFVNPASSGGQTTFSKNLVYQENSLLTVEWTIGETDQDATVALYQVDLRTSLPTDEAPETLGDMEYVAEGQAFNRNTRNWIVATRKDLSISPVFMMVLFVTEATSASDRTVFFNISSADSTTSSVSATTNTASIPTSSPNPSPATTALAPVLPSTSSTSSDPLPSSAKIGLGVGIPAAAIIGVGLGWLAFRRGKAQGRQQGPQRPPHEDRPMDIVGYSTDTPKPASSIVTYVDSLNKPAHGPPSNAPVYGPPSNAPAYGLHPNAPAYGPVSNAPVYYRPVSSSPVYEANNEPPPPSELYTPYNTRQ